MEAFVDNILKENLKINREVKRCTKCILSENFPGIKFDEHGVCNFCNNEMFHSTDEKQIKDADSLINEMFKNERGKSEYDAVFCYSGGKDSTYTLRLAVEKYKLKVLAFTLDNGFISPVAIKNIKKVVTKLGVDHIIYRPSYKFMTDLFRVSSTCSIYSPKTLTRISANCNSCISIINIQALKYAIGKHIPFIIAGFTLGQIPCNAIVYKSNYAFLEESRRSVLNKLKSQIGPEVSEYLEISNHVIDNVRKYPFNVNLLCLEDITEAEIVENIKSLGWESPSDVDGCSTNCRINAFNNFVHFKKCGFNPYDLELSHLVRKKLLTREEALDKLSNQPKEQICNAMRELKINKDDL